MASLVSSNLQFLSLSLSSMTLTFLKSTNEVFYRMTLDWCLCDDFSQLSGVWGFWKDHRGKCPAQYITPGDRIARCLLLITLTLLTQVR